MTATEIIYAVREKLKAYTDDSVYSDQYLMYLINLKRSLYLRREYNQAQRTFDTSVLSSFCMELEEVDASVCPECLEIGYKDCYVIRTKLKLPNTIELHSRNTVVKVSPIGVFDKSFSLVSYPKIIYSGEGKYEDKYVFATVHPNRHIYLKSKRTDYRGLTYINVIALIENPDDLSLFTCGTGNCYNPDETPYPAQSWMVDIIISDIVRELANLKNIPQDATNDAKDIVVEQQ